MSSKYFYCPKCHNTMDDMEALCFTPEIHTELPEKPIEWVAEERCIYCNYPDLEEANWCEECGELVPESELVDGLCKECRGAESDEE